jgi:hypothetical protein
MTTIDPGAYRSQGYVLCKGFLDPDEVDLVHREAMGVFARQMVRLGILEAPEVGTPAFEAGMFALFERDVATFANCGKQAQHLISLHRLSLDDRLVAALRSLGLELPNISTRPVLYFNHPRLAKKEVYWRLGPHQDWRSMQGSLNSVVAWVPLADVSTELGALEIVPASHLGGLVDAEMVDGYGNVRDEVDDAAMVSVEVQRGDALFFSTFLLHRSGTNVSEHIRWSCHFRYNDLAEPTFVERGYPHPYVYAPQEELITPGFPSREQVRAAFG